MSYRVEYTESVRRDLRRLPGFYRQRVRRTIEALADDPRPPQAKELRGLPGRYRLWIGDYRLIYAVDDEAILVVILRVRRKTGPETYEGTE